jgi:8-oxo-dGTP pyrophosphatase MutT (NUDIX family)
MEKNRRFGVGILAWIFNPDFSKILLLKRNKEKREKYGFDWGGVGGKLEFGELSEEGIIREAIEEIGVKIDKSKLKLLFVKEHPDFTKEVHGFHWIYGSILPENSKIKVNEESDEYKWFDIKKLPDSMFDSKEDIIEIANKAKEVFKNN